MLADSSFREIWLHDPAFDDPACAATCLARTPWGSQDPYWNVTDSSAVSHWLNDVIDYLGHDPAMQGGRAAVFFDAFDQGTCGFLGGSCDCSKFDSNQLQVLRKMVMQLNKASIVPVLSLDSRLEASQEQLSGILMPCAQPEDALLKELEGLTWVCFCENWPQSFWVPV